MTQIPDPSPIDELQFALSEGEAEPPPRALGELILAAALDARTPGRPHDPAPTITPAEAFRRSTVSFDALLSSLEADEWTSDTIRNLSVQELMGHLIAVERDFLSALEQPDGPQAGADHVGSTDPLAHAQVSQPPATTLGAWRVAVRETLARLGELTRDPVAYGQPLGLHGIRLPLGALLVVRTFELWTHQEDVRRGTGRALEAPDDSTLQLMTDLAFELLPSALARAGIAERGTRVVLTGPGGRTWLRDGGSSVPDVRIVMGAVEFCRLVANRIDLGAVPASVTGDRDLADGLFAAAAGLALD
jgi:uncharacterized protein (TIGR03083 family)